MESQDQNSASQSSSKWPIVIIALVIIATVSGAAYFWNHPGPSAKPKEKGAYMFAYSNLDSFTLKGAQSGSRMSFSKPAEYKLIYTAPNNDQASLRQSITSGQNHPMIGGIDAAEAVAAKTISDSEAKLYGATFASSTNKSYAELVKPIQNFVSGRLGTIYDVKLDPAQSFQSSYITKNAWSWQFSASPKKISTTSSTSPAKAPFDTSKAKPVPSNASVQSSPGLLNYKGKVMLIIGKNTYYYFLIYNTTYNWDNNTSTWDKVFNSLGIDQ